MLLPHAFEASLAPTKRHGNHIPTSSPKQGPTLPLFTERTVSLNRMLRACAATSGKLMRRLRLRLGARLMNGDCKSARTPPNPMTLIGEEAKRHARQGVFWPPFDRLNWPASSPDRERAQGEYCRAYFAAIEDGLGRR